MGVGLEVKQLQKLMMTPELRQAISILQLSSLELKSYVEEQVQENPVLELNEEQENRNKEPVESETNDQFDINWREYFNDSSDLGMPLKEKNRYDKDFVFENIVSKPPTLDSHLVFQLHLSSIDDSAKHIGEYIIGNLDHNGYLQISLEEMVKQLYVSFSRAKKVLDLIQTFDPPGVGARTLKECLLIQVYQYDYNDELLEQVIQNHLDDVAGSKYHQIARSLGISIKQVQEKVDILRTLDPKPGCSYTRSTDNRYIIPDVTLEKVEGEFVVIINDTYMPRLSINSTYRSVIQENNYDKNTRHFVESKLNAATWLIKSIEQRRLTLYKIVNCLVKVQRSFLDNGIKYLKPLNLKTVADLVGLHESTVSRATSNKYIQTPQGVFELKFFFSSGLKNQAGGMVSAKSIKIMLQELIDRENDKKPVNDQCIADELAGKGVKISRRTVAKYREELGIPSVKKRKRY